MSTNSNSDITMNIVSINPGTQNALHIANWIENEWQGIPIISWLRYPLSLAHYQLFPIVLGYIDPRERELCACGALLLNDMEDRPDLNPWLGCLYVLPDGRRKGIGRKLVRALVEIAKVKEIFNLYLFCNPHLSLFYESEGWQTIESRIYEGTPCVIMERKVL